MRQLPAPSCLGGDGIRSWGVVRGSHLILRVLPGRRHVSRLTVGSTGARGFVGSDAKRAGARVLGARDGRPK